MPARTPVSTSSHTQLPPTNAPSIVVHPKFRQVHSQPNARTVASASTSLEDR